jgi:signal transduction histidine kinase
MLEKIPFLSTGKPSAQENRAALWVVAVSCFVFISTLPFAKVQLAPVFAFIPIYESALILSDLITAAFLFAQFKVIRTHGLLVIGTAYIFSACLAMAHLATFPGLFSDTGIFGSGPQTTAWLYMLWHAGFPVIVIYYTLLRRKVEFLINEHHTTRHIFTNIFGAVFCAFASFLLVTAGHEHFPSIMSGDQYTGIMKFVVGSVWLITIAALVLLWRKKTRTVLELWLMVVLIAWIFDVGLAAVFNHGRFDLGFYAGRLYGLFASLVVLVFFIFENFTLYRKLVEKTVELTSLNRDLEDFSYSVSHDLKGPVRRISSYASFLEADHSHSLNDDAKNLVRSLVGNTKTMIQLIDGLLAFSKLGRQKIEARPVDLKKLALVVYGELEPEGRKVNFSCENLGKVWGDPVLLRQVLANLISNAVKFTRDANPAVIQCGSLMQNGRRVFFIKDNGAGFDMKHAGKLFGVFKRLHATNEFEGNGVGLAIVKKIIERHGGRIWAEAAQGKGATFYFYLDTSAPPAF